MPANVLKSFTSVPGSLISKIIHQKNRDIIYWSAIPFAFAGKENNKSF